MKQVFAFSKINFLLLGIGIAIVIAGLVLMSGDGSTHEAFNPDIFSATRIKVAPAVSLFGYLFIVVAILFPSRRKDNEAQASADNELTAE